MKSLALRRLVSAVSRWTLVSCCVGLLVGVRARYVGHLLFGGGVLFDSEGFSRMCRVSRLFSTDVWLLGVNTYDGWPSGARTGYSTLSDGLLLGMAWLVRGAGWALERLDDRLGVIIQSGAMDYGGGLLAVTVGVVVAAALWWRLDAQRWGRWRGGVWGVFMLMPPLIFATRFGALDESVFALAFLGWILVIEDSAESCGKWPSVVSGFLSGMAMWAAPRFSWPVMVMVMVGRCFRGQPSVGAFRVLLRWIIPLFGVVALAVLVDGWAWLGSLVADGAGRWHSSQSLWHPVEDSLAPLLWFGGTIAIPVVALFGGAEHSARSRWQTLVACSGLSAVVASWWMPAWASLAVILIALCVEPAQRVVVRLFESLPSPWRLCGWRMRIVLAFVAFGGIWPVARWWEGWMFPTESRIAEMMEYREEMGQLRRIALETRGGGLQPFLAPWYLSSAMSYWSMQPSVSRFTLLEGAETDFATAFFGSTDVSAQREVLLSRGVRWIVCDAPDRYERNGMRMGLPRSSEREPAFRTLRKGRQITEPLGYRRVFTTGTFVVLEPIGSAESPQR